ncbi:hypothetical protein AOLI_G00255980 [Acnodon oligacanthus]
MWRAKEEGAARGANRGASAKSRHCDLKTEVLLRPQPPDLDLDLGMVAEFPQKLRITKIVLRLETVALNAAPDD